MEHWLWDATAIVRILCEPRLLPLVVTAWPPALAPFTVSLLLEGPFHQFLVTGGPFSLVSLSPRSTHQTWLPPLSCCSIQPGMYTGYGSSVHPACSALAVSMFQVLFRKMQTCYNLKCVGICTNENMSGSRFCFRFQSNVNFY